mmetsp:Transcript_17545/g.48967  ORF Transcript_17545/g.48967 Transcript_17545/m.48967 type:complete len:212 (+) Transcript_17545:136-771(+)|eukprot:CAMPEP_0117665664 /NCGR_PEP_ID=MMETSP0804-20121206/9941_1 /TAXON_ID=1074897 /ORGANISM="Tetraselmis astigmatica, Strain CCMP880" /LENGTH=211 /DNA_ID=CAMNT_0005473113 /DNA_START=189 /DNA_END=824 /DNA_ORIENTATION=-
MLTPEAQKQVDSMLLKDLRVELRSRGLNPAGGAEALRERLTESIVGGAAPLSSGQVAVPMDPERMSNNYTRSNGQNVGNFITDRPTSRVLEQPGGKSQISFGWEEPEQKVAPKNVAPAAADENTDTNVGNNYSRPDGQNVGNFITDRPSSKVLAPPGGGSNVILGGDNPQTSHQQNNYGRPEGQNIGNFLTDRPSSHVLQPPGGASQIIFG